MILIIYLDELRSIELLTYRRCLMRERDLSLKPLLCSVDLISIIFKYFHVSKTVYIILLNVEVNNNVHLGVCRRRTWMTDWSTISGVAFDKEKSMFVWTNMMDERGG